MGNKDLLIVRRPKRIVYLEDTIVDTFNTVEYIVSYGDLYMRRIPNELGLGEISRTVHWDKIGKIIAEFDEISISIE